MASSAQNTPNSGPPPAVQLSTCAKKHLEMVVDYNKNRKSRADPNQNIPVSRIDDMISELAARLDARVATDGPVLKSDLVLSLKEFTLFQRLPTELSDKIWVFAAMNQPRRVEIEHNAITDRFDRVTLYERNPPIVLRHVCRYLRDMPPKFLGYSVLNIKSPVYDKICSYWFHPDVDMLSISRVYKDDAPSTSQEKPQHAMAIINELKKKNVLDRIRYLAINASILCKISWHLLPPTSFERARPSWHSDVDNGFLNAAAPSMHGQSNPPNLRAQTSIISKFTNLELLLSINTLCRHPARISMNLDDTALEFEKCRPDRSRDYHSDDHLCKSKCYRVHNYIRTQELRDDGTSPHIIMVHDARRNSPTGGKLWEGGWPAR